MIEFIIQYWVGVIFGAIITSISFLYKNIIQYKKNLEIQNNSLKALLQDRIFQAYEFHHGKGCFNLYSRKVIEDMFQQYKSLGGNGVMDDIMEKLLDLPLEDSSEEAKK